MTMSIRLRLFLAQIVMIVILLQPEAKVAIMIGPLRVCNTRGSIPCFLNRPRSTPTHIGAMVSL